MNSQEALLLNIIGGLIAAILYTGLVRSILKIRKLLRARAQQHIQDVHVTSEITHTHKTSDYSRKLKRLISSVYEKNNKTHVLLAQILTLQSDRHVVYQSWFLTLFSLLYLFGLLIFPCLYNVTRYWVVLEILGIVGVVFSALTVFKADNVVTEHYEAMLDGLA